MPLYPQGGGLYPDSISNDILADMPANTVKGRAAGTGTGNPTDIPMSSLVAASQGLSYRNILGRNGGMEVWQRGAGGSASFPAVAGSIQYTADGWVFYCPSGGSTHSVLQIAVAAPNGSRYGFVAQRVAGQTGLPAPTLEYPLDTDEVAQMRGNLVTLSFSAFPASNFSPAGGLVTCQVRVGTGAPVKRFVSGYTSETVLINATAAVTSLQAPPFAFTSSVVVPTNATQGCVAFTWTPTGTAGAADYFWLDDVQLEVGSVATPFERRPFESELLACQRHYWKTFRYAIAPVQSAGVNTCDHQFAAVAPASNSFWHFLPHPMRMRATPTIVTYNPEAMNNQVRCALVAQDCSSTSILGSERGMQLVAVTGAGNSPQHLLAVHITADAGI
jgi:hypothetical protein